MSTVMKCKTVNKVVLIEVDLIVPNPSQPRIVFKEEEIKSLAESIASNGLLQPLTVRKCMNSFELISGERRLRAIKHAGIKLAPCIIVDTTDKQSAIFALLENLQREDLNYFEEAMAMKNLIVEWNVSQQELGTRLGKAQPTIANKLRLLKFDKDIQLLLIKSGINERQARTLLRIENKNEIDLAVQSIVEKKMNVAQTENYIDNLLECNKIEKKTFHPILKDVRIFINTINNAISLMKKSGIPAMSEKREVDGYVEYTVKIPIAANRAEKKNK